MLGYEKDAKDEAQKAFKLASNLPREEQFSIEARYRELSHQWDEAIRLYQTLWHDYPDDIEYGLRLASAQKSSGKAKDSLATVEMLRALPVPSRDDPRIDLAEAYATHGLGDLKQSQQAATRAAEKSEAIGSSNILAKAKTAQAKVLFEQQDLAAALNLFRQSLDIYQQVGDNIGVTASLSNIASVLQAQGQFSESLGMYEKALAIYLKAGDKTSAALTLNNMGAVYESQRNFAEAKKTYGKSLDLYRELGDKLNQGFVLNNLAQVLFLDGDLGEREKCTRARWRSIAKMQTRWPPPKLCMTLAKCWLHRVISQVPANRWRGLEYPDCHRRGRLGQQRSPRPGTTVTGRRPSAGCGKRRAQAFCRGYREEARRTRGPVPDCSGAGLAVAKQVTRSRCGSHSRSIVGGRNQRPGSQLSFKISAARVEELAGRSEAQSQAAQTLQQCLGQAAKGGFLAQQMEAELALGELEIASGKSDAGRARLQGLQKQATSRGYLASAPSHHCAPAIRVKIVPFSSRFDRRHNCAWASAGDQRKKYFLRARTDAFPRSTRAMFRPRGVVGIRLERSVGSPPAASEIDKVSPFAIPGPPVNATVAK